MSSHTPPATLESINAAITAMGSNITSIGSNLTAIDGRLALVETNYVPPLSPGTTVDDPVPPTEAQLREKAFEVQVIADPELLALEKEKCEYRRMFAYGAGYKILKGSRSTSVVNTFAEGYKWVEEDIANRRANIWCSMSGRKLQ